MAQTRINSSDIHLGMRFTAPVFFDDGKNMFLAEKRPVKQYHINALERWAIPFLLTYGTLIGDGNIAFTEVKNDAESSAGDNTQFDESVLLEDDDVEELDVLEELDMIDDIDDMEEL